MKQNEAIAALERVKLRSVRLLHKQITTDTANGINAVIDFIHAELRKLKSQARRK